MLKTLGSIPSTFYPVKMELKQKKKADQTHRFLRGDVEQEEHTELLHRL